MKKLELLNLLNEQMHTQECEIVTIEYNYRNNYISVEFEHSEYYGSLSVDIYEYESISMLDLYINDLDLTYSLKDINNLNAYLNALSE